MYCDYKILDQKYLEKYGHRFYKVYEEGDEDRYVFPERHSQHQIMLYHRYHKIVFHEYQSRRYLQWRQNYDPQKTYVYMTFCYCDHMGNLCPQCAALNTTDFYGLQVPLHSEDLKAMTDVLVATGWKTHNIYAWLLLWIQQISICNNVLRDDRLIFWKFTSFSPYSNYKNPHRMFRFLMSRVLYPTTIYPDHKRPAIIQVNKNTVDIRTCDAFIQLSLERYKKNQQIETIRSRRHYSRITWCNLQENSVNEKMQQPYKIQFQKCLDEIEHEVAYRPSMVGMLQTRDHFYSLAS